MLERRQFLALAAGCALSPVAARAEGYPDRQIEIICPFGAGGGLDQLYRFLSARLEKLTGQGMVFENRAGASGLIATQQLIRSKPDGYTLMLGVTTSLMGNPLSMKDARYDPFNDLTPVTTLGEIGFILVVDPKLKVNNVAELTQHLRDRGELGNFGVQSLSNMLLSEFYKDAAKLKTSRINYKVMTDIAGAIFGGELDFAFLDAGLAAAQIRAGRVKPLATSTAKRLKAMPDLPTLVESGFPELAYVATMGCWLPAGAPGEAVTKLTALFTEAMKAPETAKLYASLGAEPLPGDAALLTQRMTSERDRLSRLASLVNIRPE
jgi:tripartite-type tricarboxylate transporter receptor subunit TctC